MKAATAKKKRRESTAKLRAQREGWLEYDIRLHVEREAAKQHIAKTQRRRTKSIQNIILQERIGAPHAQRVTSSCPNPTSPSASYLRPIKAAKKAAALVRTNATATNVLFFAAAAALSVATR